MDQIRVLHIQRMSAISGSEKYIRDLSFAQRRAGYDVAVAISCNKSDYHKLDGFAKELKEKGIDAFVLYSRKWFSRKMIGSLTRLCREWQPSLVHTHLLHADVYASVIKKFFIPSLKIISTKHGFQESYLEQYGFAVTSQLKRMPFYRLSRLAEKKIDQSYTISRAMSNFYYASKITRKALPVVYHGLPEETRNKNDTANRNAVSPLLVVAVGRLSPYKGYSYLIKAIAVLKERFPEIRLKIVGDGVMRAELENLAKELNIEKNILFLGFQPQPDLVLQEAAVVVIPALVEAFGLVFLEAMAFEKPIVAFDTPAGNEIIKSQQTGLLVELRDVNKMAEAIEKLLLDPGMAAQLGKKGRELLDKNFTFERVIDEVNSLYRSLIEK